MDKQAFALESFRNIQELIRFIDQKSGAVLVIAGFTFTGFVEFTTGLNREAVMQGGFIGILCFLSGLATVLCLMVVIWLSIFKVSKPRLVMNYSEKKHSLFYFEHLSKLGKENTLSEYRKLTDDSMLKNIIDQQYEVSQVMVKKTKFLGISFNFLFASIISLVIFIMTSMTL